MPTWAEEFRSFTWLHAATLAWTLGALAVSVWVGRRWLSRGEKHKEQRLAIAWGVFAVGVNVWSLAYWAMPANFAIGKSLPLHVCDLACLTAPLVFLTRWRWARTLVYFWGIGLSTQAFVTPTVRVGPALAGYWLFWSVHLVIVGSGVYDVLVRSYRPGARDLRLAIVALLAYGALAIGVNLWLGTNYGYVGDSRPASPTLVDSLGDWPWRLAPMGVIALGWMTALWAVWQIGGHTRAGRPEGGRAA